jgi:hypothetical protein
MKLPTFEEFLEERHAENFPMLLDDDMPDHFADWLGTLDGEDYIKYAEAYGKEAYNLGSYHGHKDGLHEANNV